MIICLSFVLVRPRHPQVFTGCKTGAAAQREEAYGSQIVLKFAPMQESVPPGSIDLHTGTLATKSGVYGKVDPNRSLPPVKTSILRGMLDDRNSNRFGRSVALDTGHPLPCAALARSHAPKYGWGDTHDHGIRFECRHGGRTRQPQPGGSWSAEKPGKPAKTIPERAQLTHRAAPCRRTACRERCGMAYHHALEGREDSRPTHRYAYDGESPERRAQTEGRSDPADPGPRSISTLRCNRAGTSDRSRLRLKKAAT